MAWADIDETAAHYVNDVLNSGWLSRRRYLPRFEKEMAALHGQKHGLMLNSGTDALRIALATLKELHKWKDGSEVLVPAVTFVATVNVVLQNKLTPVFVDVDRFTYNIDVGLIESKIGPDTKAILPVHLFGLPADMLAVMGLAKRHKLKVIEDSCECLGVHRIRGDIACFSTYMAHMIQTGVGGVLTTNSPTYHALATSYANHGRSANPNKFEFERIGYSSRATELEAALGCAQLLRKSTILERRDAIALRLRSGLCCLPLQLPVLERSSWMLFPLVLLDGSRDTFMSYMLRKGIETRQMMPLTDQPCYKGLVKESDFPVAEWINKNGVCLPCHQLITDEQVDYMVECVKGFFK